MVAKHCPTPGGERAAALSNNRAGLCMPLRLFLLALALWPSIFMMACSRLDPPSAAMLPSGQRRWRTCLLNAQKISLRHTRKLPAKRAKNSLQFPAIAAGNLGRERGPGRTRNRRKCVQIPDNMGESFFSRLAAVRRAVRWVASIISLSGLLPLAASSAKIRLNTPRRLQRMNRL